MNVKTLGLITGLALCGTAFAQTATQGQQPPSSGQMEQQPSGQMGHEKMGQEKKGQKELSGVVVGIKQTDVLVRLNDDPGAIVPLKVDHMTQIDGKPIKKGENLEAYLKKDLSPGAEVRASFDLQKMENKAVSIDHQAKK